MRTLIYVLAVLCFTFQAGLAQSAKGGQRLMELQTQARQKEQKPAPMSEPKPAGEILGRKVIYGGYLTELRRAERKRQLFDLRTPSDENKDMEHVAFYPGVEKIQGFIFFSIKF
jgi:hypothetical protein